MTRPSEADAGALRAFCNSAVTHDVCTAALWNADTDATWRRITLRLMPLLFLSFVFNYIDRINIGYAQLQMKPQLGFTDAAYGIGASMFYVGYLLFEIPSNLAMQRIGARKTLLRIMFLWGMTSASTMFIRTPFEFYVVRFLLGVFEAGFFPGVMLYLTFWYPPERRARIVAMLMSAGVVAGILAGPLSGAIIQHLDGLGGLSGWQWMYVLQGLPCCLLGILAYVHLSDRPEQAKWLGKEERELIASQVGQARQPFHTPVHGALQAAWRLPSLLILAYLYFALCYGTYTMSFWLPAMIQRWKASSIQVIGFYSVIPYSFGMLAMFWLAGRSDARGGHRKNLAVCFGVAALGLAATNCTSCSFWMSMALVTTGMAGLIAAFPLFWALATSMLPKEAAPVGIATITTVSGLAGALCPSAMGLIKTLTGSTAIGLYLVAVLLVCASVLTWRQRALSVLPSPSHVPQ
ncbi:MFS transporter [Paraburkholderia sp. CNPSo 3272]|uniref:MFS transporter n=1 Tax=Paraburkholderia sp. CNPSo 3272 TaxID=2940931 RepID=UPI0020B647BD|nr:MFS transporter [Paraburkholderia sp. CNPSo 3272]MCP3728088.1 MFS transporter [Paraburkholderia sp. CNPSo 3272]